MTTQHPEKGKKIYEKPEIKVIDLAAEEVMAVGCKTPTTVPAGSSPGPGCLAQSCLQTGS